MYPIDALYARQSLDKKDSISIESQLDFCRYETHGNEYETFVDKGFSGKNTNRPDFERLIKAIKEGKIKRVIVYKLDRISRSILDFSNMMELFQKYNVEFVSSTEKFDTSTPMGRAMLNICIVFAQLERETIQKRVTDAYYSKSHRGYYMGGRIPYGFRLEEISIDGVLTSRFIPDPEEANRVKMIFDMYANQDATLGDIFRRLISDGSGDDKKWCTARISDIIRNPIYVRADIDIYNFFLSQGTNIISEAACFIGSNGAFMYKGKDKDRRKQSDLTDRDLVLAPHEGIIDSETWLKCRWKLLNNNQCARTKKGKRSWLTGKVKCKKCGYAYIVTKSNTTGLRYLQCSGMRYNIRCKGSEQTIYAHIFENHIYNEMREELKKFQYLSNEIEKSGNVSYSKYKMEMLEMDKEIDALLNKVSEASSTLMQYINMRIDQLDAEKKKLQEKIISLSANKPINNLEKINNHIEIWEELSIEDKQKIADILIKVIYIDNDTISIEWNI